MLDDDGLARHDTVACEGDAASPAGHDGRAARHAYVDARVDARVGASLRVDIASPIAEACGPPHRVDRETEGIVEQDGFRIDLVEEGIKGLGLGLLARVGNGADGRIGRIEGDVLAEKIAFLHG